VDLISVEGRGELSREVCVRCDDILRFMCDAARLSFFSGRSFKPVTLRRLSDVVGLWTRNTLEMAVGREVDELVILVVNFSYVSRFFHARSDERDDCCSRELLEGSEVKAVDREPSVS